MGLTAEKLDFELGDELIDDEVIWEPEPEAVEDPILLNKARKKLGEIPQIKPSDFTAYAFRMPRAKGDGYENFSFDGRRHMQRIYDTPAKRVLLCCARQVEKSVVCSTRVLLPDGLRKQAGDIVVGDEVATLDVPAGGSKMTVGRVVWASGRYYKPCVRIQTRQGHVCEVATTHPMRVWGGWLDAGEVKVGTRLAVVRRSGTFFNEDALPERIRLTAYMVGDGCTSANFSFTSLPGAKLLEFMEDLESIKQPYRVHADKGRAVGIRMRTGLLQTWLTEDGLWGARSANKFVPSWVFRLSKEQTALFLNRLWSTDGHVKRNSKSKYSVEYCSISPQLIRDVQALLWKFGIPSRIRRNWPSTYRKRGEKKFAYILRVETQDGVRRFLQEIGALGKCDDIELPDVGASNNRDTYPAEVNGLIRQILETNSASRYGVSPATASLRSAGLRETLEYPPTKEKLQLYVHFFRSDERYDQALVDELEKHVDTDVYWDVVVSVTGLGVRDCVDFEVEDTRNFVADGFITHNSTAVGNISLCYLTMNQAYKILYVSPSATQTKTFSADRIKEPIETSPVLKKFTTQMLSQNILEKQFVNRSKITMRYAFLNADRTRGIPAFMLALDEFQDILSDNIPVIEQCTSHAPDDMKRFIYAGTPKSLENNIEYYRINYSTQGEWVVPCSAHGGEGGRYWNILGEKNIGRKGLICEKCGKPIDPMHADAQWATMVQYNPEKKIAFESYRISQLMVPWKPWQEILLDYDRYPRDKFYNEVLGISYDSGLRPLTRAQVMRCCRDDIKLSEADKYRSLAYGQGVFMGADWGTGEHSYTVVTLGTYIGDKFRVFYVHRFTGEEIDPEIQIERIEQLIRYFNVRVVGVDYGGGFYGYKRLVKNFGPKRILRYQYAGRLKRKVDWNGALTRFAVHRTEVMSDIFNAIKAQKCEFPRWEEFKDPYAQDMLNIFSEYSETLRMIQYKHAPDRPDDTFHSLLYCWLASMVVHPRPDIIAPVQIDPHTNQPRPLYSGWVDQG